MHLKKNVDLSKGDLIITIYITVTISMLVYHPVFVIYPAWNSSNISHVFVKRHNFKTDGHEDDTGVFDIHSGTSRHSVHGAISFYIQKMLICSDNKRTVCFEIKYETLLYMNLQPPRKTATSPQTKDLSKRPAWTGWSIPYFSLPVLEEWRRHVGKNDKNQCFGLKYRVDQYREEEKNQRKAIPVCLNKN